MKSEVMNIYNEIKDSLTEPFAKIDEICAFNSEKVLNAFWKNNISEIHFNSTTGYGYGDIGSDRKSLCKYL